MSASAVTLLDLSYALGQRAPGAQVVASSPASSAAEASPASSSVHAADILKQSGGPTIIALPDPSTREERDYLVVPSCNAGKENCCDVFEVQSLTGPSKYGSFFVGPRVVSDGALRVATRIDPLFFVLAEVEAKSKQQAANTNANSDPNKSQSATGGNSKWQPLDQLLADVHPCVREALRNAASRNDALTPEKVLDKQMRHLFLYTDAYGDDLPFYKFDEKLARKWLRAKFDRILGAARASILREKLRQDEAKTEASKLGGGGGAFSAAFNMGDDDDEEEEVTKAVMTQSPSGSQSSTATSSSSPPTAGGADASIAMLIPEDETRARISALQLVCEYLPDAWRAKLMEEVEMTEEQLLGPRGKKRKASTPEVSKASDAVDDDDVNAICFDDDEDLTAPLPSSSNKCADYGDSAADRMLQITRGVDGCGGAAGSTANVMMDDDERQKIKKKEENLNARSHGLKKLAKVNTKGMKSLSSFFGGPKKKKKV